MNPVLLWGGIGAGGVGLLGLLILGWLAWKRGRDLRLALVESANLRDSVASYAIERARLQVRVLKLEKLALLREAEAKKNDEKEVARDPAGALVDAWGRLHPDTDQD